jgi:hypothetical protein
VKDVVDAGGWRQLHQSSADINSSKLKEKTVSLQNSDIFTQDENQLSQNVMGDIFDGNHPYSKHQNDNRKQKHETKYETISYYLILPTHQEISSSYNDFEVSVVPLPNFDV